MQDNEENEEPVTVPQAIPGPSTKKFSKAEYSRNPVTQKAHLVKDFDIDLNSLDLDIQLIHICVRYIRFCFYLLSLCFSPVSFKNVKK